MAKEVSDFSQIHDLLEGVELPEEAENPEEKSPEYKTNGKSELVTVMAWLLGLKEEHFVSFFESQNPSLAKTLREDAAACRIRDLCMLRQQLLNNYANTEHEIVYNLTQIDKMKWFDADVIDRLEKGGIHAVQYGFRADDYSLYFTKLISENIDACAHLFPEWLRFDYVEGLFYHPGYNGKDILKKEFSRYHEHRMWYPYSLYIHWNPADIGNLLISDGKFLKTLYAQHGEAFTDSSKYRDADDRTKQSIYECVDRSRRAIIVVDCENSDVFKLYGVLKNLNHDEIEKVEKIILYDDYHTTSAWTWLKNFISIPIEYEEVERVTDRKSLVDIKMTAGICKAFYQDNIDTFILCSSDSDFWGVISSLPYAHFLVMYEYSKCGQAIKDALDTRGIFHCSMDDFYTGNAADLQRVVLLHELREQAKNIVGRNCMEVTREIYETTHIPAKEAEMKHFCDKYVRSIRLKIDVNGNFYIDVTEA